MQASEIDFDTPGKLAYDVTFLNKDYRDDDAWPAVSKVLKHMKLKRNQGFALDVKQTIYGYRVKVFKVAT